MTRPEARYRPLPIRERSHGPSPRGLVSLDEAAERLNRSRGTVRAWAIAGRLEGRRIGHRFYVSEASVKAAEKIATETRSQHPNPVDGVTPHAQQERRLEDDSGASSGTIDPEAANTEPIPKTEAEDEPLTEGFRPWRI